MSREDAYTLMQKIALKCWEEQSSFEMAIRENEQVKNMLRTEELDALFVPDYYLRNVDKIYERFIDSSK